MFIETLFEERYKDFNKYIYYKSHEIDENSCSSYIRSIIEITQNPLKTPYENLEDFICDLYNNGIICDIDVLDPIFDISGYESSKNKNFLKNPVNNIYVLSSPYDYMKELIVVFNMIAKKFPIADTNKYCVLFGKLTNGKTFMRPFTQISLKDFLLYMSINLCENTDINELTIKDSKKVSIPDTVGIASFGFVSSNFDKDIENEFKRLDPLCLMKRRRRNYNDITDTIVKVGIIAEHEAH